MICGARRQPGRKTFSDIGGAYGARFASSTAVFNKPAARGQTIQMTIFICAWSESEPSGDKYLGASL